VYWVRQDAATQTARAPGALLQRFLDLDRNGNGKLTPDEFPDPSLFKQTDANGDGVVTLEEARAFFSRNGRE